MAHDRPIAIGKPPKDENGEETLDPFDINVDEGAWCPKCKCWPQWLNMGAMTIIASILGFIFGILLYNVNVTDSWVSCYDPSYSATDPPTPMPTMTAMPTLSPSADVTAAPVTATATATNDYTGSCWLEIIVLPGQLWINALKLLIFPLMSTMMLTLPERLGDIAPVAKRLLGFLLFTSFVAAIEGLIWGNIFQPGDGVNYDVPDEACGDVSDYDSMSEFETFLNLFYLFVPSNIVVAIYGSKILGIIMFFLAMGIKINEGPKEWSKPIGDISKGVLKATLKLLLALMWWTPIALFSLVSYYMAGTDDLGAVFAALAKYVGAQILGQAVHLFVFYFGFYFITTGKNPLEYFWKIRQAPFTALATSSSAATMPVTIRVNKEAGNDERLVMFTIPLGAAMNMDGTSLGFPIMVLFTSQLVGSAGACGFGDSGDYTLSFGTQLTVALVAMVCSLGTAPVPNAGLVFLTMLYQTANIPDDIANYGLALITTVDWLIDRVETAQNVTSDSFICGILNHYARGGSGILSPCMKGIKMGDVHDGEAVASKGGIQANEAADNL